MKKTLVRVQSLLKSLVIISPEIRKKLLSQCESFSTEKLEILLSFLVEAEQNQKTLLWKSSNENPQFFADLKRKGSQLKQEDTRAKEGEEHKEEQKQLTDLEAELENLFNEK